MPSKIAEKNVLRTLGALCVDKDFRDAYFEKRSIDVVHNQTTPKINITRTEYQDFNAMLPSPTSGPQKQDFEVLGARLCPRYPCRLATADREMVLGSLLIDDGLRMAVFNKVNPSPGVQPSGLETKDAMDIIAKQIDAATTPVEYVLPEVA